MDVSQPIEASRRLFEPLARAGYASRGVVYVLIGVFAVLAAIGSGDKIDSKGALLKLFQQPFGEVLVWILIIGLFGYVLWRLIQVTLDPDHYGHDAKGVFTRLALLGSAISYGSLAMFALSKLGVLSSGGGSDGGTKTMVADWFEKMLGGQIVAGVIALVLIGFAIYQWGKAAKQSYVKRFEIDDETLSKVNPVCMAGLIARGAVFAICGGLLAYRAVTYESPSTKPPGVEDAMRFVQQLPAGNILLIIMGIGLISYAGYSFIEAKYRRIDMDEARI